MRILALYLPQFHRVAENDAWWGEGFTEWTTVRAAERLFPGHQQPKVPLGQDYYDLSRHDTMASQAELMHRYTIDGMCFYHYWFKAGRRILEKPAENLLQWDDIDMPFCFSWANESWVRSWSKLSEADGNPWSAKFDRMQTAGERGDGILLEQDYGDEAAWRAHYAYLRPFFRDARYIQQEGMPVFAIYKPDRIPCLGPMLALWDEMARQDGFPGLYVIGMNTQKTATDGLKGTALQEPQDTMMRYFPEKYDTDRPVMKYLDYGEVWQHILAKPVREGVSLGAFTGYDDTPRRGHGGVVIDHRDAGIFGRSMTALLQKAGRIGSPFVFINAWNEWGEGMYLEPDETDGYAFLEALKHARQQAAGGQLVDSDDGQSAEVLKDELRRQTRTMERYSGYWHTFDRWMLLLEESADIATYFHQQGWKEIAVYGAGMMGKHLLRQMERCGITPSFVVDRNREKAIGGCRVCAPEDALPEADVMIVTVMWDYLRIRSEMEAHFHGQILSLDEWIALEEAAREKARQKE